MKAQVDRYKMCIGGEWVDRNEQIHVFDPQNEELIATVPQASGADMVSAINEAIEGVAIAAQLPTHERISILTKVASLLKERQEEFASIIAREGSKTIREARKEVLRSVETLTISAEEARRINGETIAFDQMPGSEQRMGYYYRFPIGLIAAITPFNDPLNLVAHKVGPAIASGNAIIVKPASMTPISALKLAALFEEAGLPKKVLTIVTGSGKELGPPLFASKLIQMISFTGGLEAGIDIANQSGIKKLGMELGSNSPAIVLNDADIDQAAKAITSGAFSAAGQNCIGVQRVFVETDVYQQFKREFTSQAVAYKIGDKQSEETDMGPLIHEQEAKRVEAWVNEAIDLGAELLCGGKRQGAFYEPTILANVPDDCTIAKEEIFGPVALLYQVSDLEAAITRANEVDFGLQAGVFTKHVDRIFKAVHQIKVGGVMINDSSDYRIDAMPFGGVKQSGLGREGIKFAIQEMTEPKVVCFNLA